MAANSPCFLAFAEGLRAALDRADLPTNAPLAIGVSGGADSMALALLAQEWSQTHHAPLHCYTVDHALRPESADEAAQVAAWLTARFIPHRTLVWQHGKVSGNLQQQARTARYELLRTAAQADGGRAVLVAHHADDQAETVLANLVRGSGVDGLSAMPVARPLEHGMWLLRPLLGVSKAELEAHCTAHHQPWIEDPSNQSPRFTRVVLRQLLAQFEPQGLSSQRLAEVAQHMQRARAALEHMTQAWWQAHAHCTPETIVFPVPEWRTLPEEIQLRVLLRAHQQLEPHRQRPRMESMWRIHAALLAGETTRLSLGECWWNITPATATCEHAAPCS